MIANAKHGIKAALRLLENHGNSIAAHISHPGLGQSHEVCVVEDDLALEEQFLMNMGASPRPQEGPVPVETDEIRHLLDGVWGTIHGDEPLEADTVPRIADITDALSVLEDVLPEDHPDVVNLKALKDRLL